MSTEDGEHGHSVSAEGGHLRYSVRIEDGLPGHSVWTENNGQQGHSMKTENCQHEHTCLGVVSVK